MKKKGKLEANLKSNGGDFAYPSIELSFSLHQAYILLPESTQSGAKKVENL